MPNEEQIKPQKQQQGLSTWRLNKPQCRKKLQKRAQNGFGSAVVVAAAVACYAKTPFGELVHDDIFAIERNADIRPEAPISALFLNDYWGKSLKSPDSHKSYRPLCVLSFRAQFWLHGSRPFGYRFVNVLLHIAVCLSLVRLCDGVLACSKMFSVMTGLVFAVHPIHAEAVRVVRRASCQAAQLLCNEWTFIINDWIN